MSAGTAPGVFKISLAHHSMASPAFQRYFASILLVGASLFVVPFGTLVLLVLGFALGGVTAGDVDVHTGGVA